MKSENRETLQRALGMIEGVSLTLETSARYALDAAGEMIVAVLDDEKERVNMKYEADL